MTPLIKIKKLRCSRDKRVVVEIDEFEINKDQVLAVIGPNGAGKSSFLHILTRLLRIDQGDVLWDDRSIFAMPALEYRRKLALVMQEPLLLDRSVRDNIAIGLNFRGEEKTEIDRKITIWAEKFRISNLLDRPAKKISGGEAQRVSLARAFVLEPELLLLDEPFSALDPQTRKEIVKDLKVVLTQTKTTTVFVTHDLNDVAILADQVVLVWDGSILQSGTFKYVSENPVNAAARNYLTMN